MSSIHPSILAREISIAFPYEHAGRIETIRRCNPVCADCSAEDPQWACLLMNGESCEGLGIVICNDCALQHYSEVGQERCFIKYLPYFHEWTDHELDMMEFSGNDVVNGVYEAFFEQRPPPHGTKRHAKFLRNKYKRMKWRDTIELTRALEIVSQRTAEAKEARRNARIAQPKSKDEDQKSQSHWQPRDGSLVSFVDRGSLLSMASDLTGSSHLSICDIEDEEDFYLDCARMTGSEIVSGRPFDSQPHTDTFDCHLKPRKSSKYQQPRKPSRKPA